MVFHRGCINGEGNPLRMKGVICSVKGAKPLKYIVNHDAGNFVRGAIVIPPREKEEELIFHCLDCDTDIPESSLSAE